jgi:TorA maturation chaperone TorD
MPTNSVPSLIFRLDQWLSSLESVRLLFHTQVTQLDLAISEINLNQSYPSAVQHIHSIHDTLANQLSEVLKEISNLNLAKQLLATSQPTSREYKHLFRLSDRRAALRHRSVYYQDLSDLFDSIYDYLYRH